MHVDNACADPQAHIPYRNHKLTMLMSDSLGGTAKTLMFVNVSPTDSNLDETQTSLQVRAHVAPAAAPKQGSCQPSRVWGRPSIITWRLRTAVYASTDSLSIEGTMTDVLTLAPAVCAVRDAGAHHQERRVAQ